MSINTTDPRAELKRKAAIEAADMVKDGMVVGLGSGSTSAFMIEELGRRWAEGLRFCAIPTSERSAEQARSHGIKLVTFATHPQIDIDIDGADEVERGTLNLIKGLGGALFREKIVAAASRRFVVVVDDSKLVDRLGAAVPVPVEVANFGWTSTARQLEALGAKVVQRLDRSGNVFVTDGGNMILDCHFGEIADSPALQRQLDGVVGVIETGLFIGRTSEVIVATADGLQRLRAA
ncbi:ribose-5-phosphate isomerase [Komagataeibacter rhaeticus]|uniref:Ribose-5-phosphate isomerase A n=1 Tax=Komagataeibacter rhaeticus TaxID=215221 RepID=A0A181C711_9PROT|nr:ribose-5-phosphate isomerase RpiA [Komagataeibacter rhaeticus]ATU73781.1 ribose-5-phosphate isomerase RpiA [Komagataeibacter xylinus]EGG78336.1 Ribose-5-phosphate isomerase A [Gluconacetobacter sp. SXCC-1]KDU94876.1 ribose 5-phosphate isomerase [Komagataeibacter rhaeticus AF1]MBL7239348.1 ribose-5-phosphate isomerase RpiA [Komagataeibacter rhaeticus]PYD55130.1 ribose-5-phosphate isomerase [Komagataeibacter rhaeticus]